MFILKLKSFGEGSDSNTAHISCKHFSLYDYGDNENQELVVFSDYSSQNGVVYRLSREPKDTPSWSVCFVENENGKTVNRLGFK